MKYSLFLLTLIFTHYVQSASVSDLVYEVIDGDIIVDGYKNVTIDQGPVIRIIDCNYNATGIMDIPSYIDGHPVYIIAPSAFKSVHGLTEIKIPNTVRYISNGAFKNNNSLQKITFPSELNYWSSSTLSNNGSLETIIFPENFQQNEISWIPLHTFEDSPIENIDIPSSIERIVNSAFRGTRLKSIIIPNGVYLVGEYAFDLAPGVTVEKLVIPDSVQELNSNGTFKFNVEEIWMGSDIKLSDRMQGYVEQYGQNSIQDPFKINLVGMGKVVYTGDSVNQLFDNDLGKNNFKEVIINSNVTTEQDFSFNGTYYSNLEAITFPDTLESLYTNDFKASTNLKSITFNGDKPLMDSDIFDGIHQDAVIFINPTSHGFSETLFGIPVNILYNIGPPIVDINESYYPQLNETTLVDATPSDGFPRDFTYQWYKDDEPIPSFLGGSSSSFNFTGDPTANGVWKVVVTNENGTTEKEFIYRVFVDDDNDGLHNDDETNTGIYISTSETGTDPSNSDSDGDSLTDGAEVLNHGTDPNKFDSDQDTLSDSEELAIYSTNPLDPDTDGDGYSDGLEAKLDPNSDSSGLNLSDYGLITSQDVQDLRPGSTMIEVSGNQATVQLQMEESSDLQTWEDTGTPATMTIPADTDTKFFRFKMAE